MSKPVSEWDAAEVAIWLQCTLGHYYDAEAVLAPFAGTDGPALLALNDHALRQDKRLNMAQTAHFLRRLDFTRRAADTELAAAAADTLVQEKQAAEDQLAAALVAMEALQLELASLQQQFGVVEEQEQQQQQEEEETTDPLADESSGDNNQEQQEEEAVVTAVAPEIVAETASSTQMTAQDEPSLGKRHYKEDTYEKNRYF